MKPFAEEMREKAEAYTKQFIDRDQSYFHFQAGARADQIVKGESHE